MINNEGTNETPGFHRHHRKPDNGNTKYLYIRNILNIIFMLGAIIGVIIYITTDFKDMATYIIIVSMIFKVAECCLRFIR